MTDKLKRLIERCKASVTVLVNEHRDVYETAVQALQDMATQQCPPDIAAAVFAKMVETDTIIVLQFYPDTPVGSYRIVHYDLDAALDMALQILEEK